MVVDNVEKRKQPTFVLLRNSFLEVIANNLFCPQYYCTSVEKSTQSKITQAMILSRHFSSVDLTGECPVEYSLKGVRYAWYTKPCDFKKCAVYSNENELPGPPFTWNAPV